MEGAVSVYGDAKLLVGRQIDAGGTASHGKWSYGSAQLKGMHITMRIIAVVGSFMLKVKRLDTKFLE